MEQDQAHEKFRADLNYMNSENFGKDNKIKNFIDELSL